MADLDIPGVSGKVICGDMLAYCHCVLSPHGDEPHLCACGGSWKYDPVTGDEIIVSMPRRVL